MKIINVSNNGKINPRKHQETLVYNITHLLKCKKLGPRGAKGPSSPIYFWLSSRTHRGPSFLMDPPILSGTHPPGQR